MTNLTPKLRVRPTFIGIVLTLICLGLLTFSCLPKAKPKPTSTPIVAVTGSGNQTDTPVSPTSTETKIYLPTIFNATATNTPGPSDSSVPPSFDPNSLGTGKIYYVATTGSDSNAGTATSPWKTIAKGVSALHAGDTLYIKSGTYILTAPIVVSASGNTTNGPITISTAPGEPSQAVITGDTNGDGTAEVPTNVYSALIEMRGSYLQVQYLKVVYSKGRGIKSGGSHNIIARNNVNHIWNSGIYIYGPDNLIEKNTVWRTADSNWCNGATGRQCNGNWPGGVAWGDVHVSTAPGAAPRIIIRNNTIFNTSGEGLLCMHSDYGLIEGNVVYDNWALNIDLDQCSYTTIQKNLVYATADKVWWKGTGRPSTGIMLSNEGIKDSNGNIYPIGHDRKVINNIVVGAGTNIFFWSGDGTGGGLPTSALVNDLIAYNTLVSTGGSGGTNIKIDAGPHSNTRITNNLVYEPTYYLASVGSTTGLTFDHNFWSKTPPAAVASPTDVIGNPLLADPNHTRTPGSVLASWYKISTTSPAVNRAIILSGISNDYWANPRGTKPDMGADEAVQ